MGMGASPASRSPVRIHKRPHDQALTVQTSQSAAAQNKTPDSKNIFSAFAASNGGMSRADSDAGMDDSDQPPTKRTHTAAAAASASGAGATPLRGSDLMRTPNTPQDEPEESFLSLIKAFVNLGIPEKGPTLERCPLCPSNLTLAEFPAHGMCDSTNS